MVAVLKFFINPYTKGRKVAVGHTLKWAAID